MQKKALVVIDIQNDIRKNHTQNKKCNQKTFL